MKIYKYNNYEEYEKSQKAAFKKKFNNIWAVEENIKAICEYLKDFNPERGLCHGVRQGYEQKWFMKYLSNCHVIGTDIGDVDIKDEFTIQWDFNKEHPTFVNRFDFLYSNSFDHAFNPAKTFKIWCNQLKTGGKMILEYDRRQEHTGEISLKHNKTDPVSITVKELVKIIPSWVDSIKDIDIINMPVITQEWRKAIIITVE